MTTPARPGPHTNGTVPAIEGDSSGLVSRGSAARLTGGGHLPPAQQGPDPYIGQTLEGRYVLDRLLGEGGMGVVYAARHTIIGKRVAIKILRSEYTRDQEILDRFVLEAKTASSIGNPHIVDISDFGRAPDGATYFVMEYLEGESLADAMMLGAPNAKAKPLEVSRLYKIAAQICDGLGAAHESSIVHRDLKPENVFLIKRGDPDFVKILDFGIAKVSNDPTQKITRAGAVFGTPQYMSPEQAAGGAVDHRADIYALGVMLYEMVSGQLPFDGDNFMGILTQHMYKAPVPVRALVNTADCPPGLEAVIQKCLLKRPENRYQTMAELGADIRRLMSSGEPSAVRDMMARSGGTAVPQDYFKSGPMAVIPASPPAKKGAPTWIFVAGGIVALGIAGATGLALLRQSKPPVPAPSAEVAPPPPVTDDAKTRDPQNVPSATASQKVEASAPTKVVLDVIPKAAIIKRDGKVFTARELMVGPTEKISLEVGANGFAPKTVVIDASEPKVEIRLVPKTAGAVQPPRSTGEGVVDTWK